MFLYRRRIAKPHNRAVQTYLDPTESPKILDHRREPLCLVGTFCSRPAKIPIEFLYQIMKIEILNIIAVTSDVPSPIHCFEVEVKLIN